MKKSKADGRSPAIQFYFRQFSGDEVVMAMDLDAVGAHILLMCAAGASEFGIGLASNERYLRNIIRNPSDSDWERIKGQLLGGAWKLSADGRWWIQDGLRRSFMKQKNFSKKQAHNAEQRWKNAKNMPPQNSGRDLALPEACPHELSLSSSSDLTTTPPTPLPGGQPQTRVRRASRSQIEASAGSGPEVKSGPQTERQKMLERLRQEWQEKREAGEIPMELGISEYRQKRLREIESQSLGATA